MIPPFGYRGIMIGSNKNIHKENKQSLGSSSAEDIRDKKGKYKKAISNR